MLHEAENKLERQSESIESLKSHARTIFGASSIVIPLLGTLLIFSDIAINVKSYYIAIVAMMITLYVVLVILSLIILSPSRFSGPIQIDHPTLKEVFLGKNELEIIKIRLSAYLNAIELNEGNIILKQKMTTIISIIFAIIVILLLIAAVLSKVTYNTDQFLNFFEYIKFHNVGC